MLKIQQNYDFKKELLCVHKKGVRKENLLPENGEFVLKDEVRIYVKEIENPVILTAVRDFEDYLFIQQLA